MFDHLTYRVMLTVVRCDARLAEHRHRDGGYTTETVIVTALLVAAALTVLGIITAKVIARANSISL